MNSSGRDMRCAIRMHRDLPSCMRIGHPCADPHTRRTSTQHGLTLQGDVVVGNRWVGHGGLSTLTLASLPLRRVRATALPLSIAAVVVGDGGAFAYRRRCTGARTAG